MRLRASPITSGAAVLSALLVLPVFAAGTGERLDRIERQLESRGLMDLLNRVEQLQQDVQQLRGALEVQGHQLEDMQRRQRDLYLDIDRRLQQLETGQPAAPAVTPPAVMPQVVMPPAVMPPAVTPPAVTPPAPATPVAPPPRPASTPAAAPENEQAEYDKALAILREGRYADAAAAFNRFLADYPGSVYADNASYWLGETYYVNREFDRALSTFSMLVEFHPHSPKVPDARLKIGFIHYEKQDWAAARKELNGLVTDDPGTTAARLARDRLQRMKQEGR